MVPNESKQYLAQFFAEKKARQACSSAGCIFGSSGFHKELCKVAPVKKSKEKLVVPFKPEARAWYAVLTCDGEYEYMQAADNGGFWEGAKEDETDLTEIESLKKVPSPEFALKEK